jgi:hypothetical protein
MEQPERYIEIHSGGYHAAFALEEPGSGELVEVVDFDESGQPEWDEAGYCDPIRGSNPNLQRALEAALVALTEEATAA